MKRFGIPPVHALSLSVLTLAALPPTAALAQAHIQAPASAPSARAAQAHHGYLDAAQLQAIADKVPAPPAAGSAEEQADHAQSQSLRQYENTDRWLMATSHTELFMPFALQHFDCAVGVRFTPETAAQTLPATSRIFQKMFEDAEAASSIVKRRNFRARPVADDPSREACQTVPPAGRASASYPSGGATVGAAYGYAMAAISPDDAEASRNIGQQIAISRAVCGMHYPQDIRAGMAVAQAVFEQASQSATFQADLVEARQEIARLKATGQTSPACAAERRAIAMGPATL